MPGRWFEKNHQLIIHSYFTILLLYTVIKLTLLNDQ